MAVFDVCPRDPGIYIWMLPVFSKLLAFLACFFLFLLRNLSSFHLNGKHIATPQQSIASWGRGSMNLWQDVE